METLSLFNMLESPVEQIELKSTSNLDVVKMEFEEVESVSWQELFSMDQGTLRFHAARSILSREKIHLLSSRDGRRKRVIMGSAAFGGRQRETICYQDSSGDTSSLQTGSSALHLWPLCGTWRFGTIKICFLILCLALYTGKAGKSKSLEELADLLEVMQTCRWTLDQLDRMRAEASERGGFGKNLSAGMKPVCSVQKLLN